MTRCRSFHLRDNASHTTDGCGAEHQAVEGRDLQLSTDPDFEAKLVEVACTGPAGAGGRVVCGREAPDPGAPANPAVAGLSRRGVPHMTHDYGDTAPHELRGAGTATGRVLQHAGPAPPPGLLVLFKLIDLHVPKDL